MDGNQHIAEESIVKLQPLMAKKSSDIIPRVLPWAMFLGAYSSFLPFVTLLLVFFF